jgi:hypothetical protein
MVDHDERRFTESCSGTLGAAGKTAMEQGRSVTKWILKRLRTAKRRHMEGRTEGAGVQSGSLLEKKCLLYQRIKSISAEG